MILHSQGQPLLLSTHQLGPTVLALGLSAGVFAGLVGYALHKVSKETGESHHLIIQRIYADVAATVARARSRWREGSVAAAWQNSWRAVLRVGAIVLAAEGLLVAGVATSKGGILGEANVWFAGTVVVLTCLLANFVMGLLWLAGPKPEQAGQRLYSHNGQRVAAKQALRLFGRRAAGPPSPPALPEA